MHNRFLYSLHDFSEHLYIAIFFVDKIDAILIEIRIKTERIDKTIWIDELCGPSFGCIKDSNCWFGYLGAYKCRLSNSNELTAEEFVPSFGVSDLCMKDSNYWISYRGAYECRISNSSELIAEEYEVLAFDNYNPMINIFLKILEIIWGIYNSLYLYYNHLPINI
ncbi:23894_t:CDS:2 [Dentiscutata erythropus]|uniref:23894_t:CDS:1 n=1 Tax=Dentiscutata erythropus TaxID=1348616 RepID=A0A9N8ZKI9_9GLOM|nr:23894_t:CDS:2 [Dentiscutata erythropus]